MPNQISHLGVISQLDVMKDSNLQMEILLICFLVNFGFLDSYLKLPKPLECTVILGFHFRFEPGRFGPAEWI